MTSLCCVSDANVVDHLCMGRGGVWCGGGGVGGVLCGGGGGGWWWRVI